MPNIVNKYEVEINIIVKQFEDFEIPDNGFAGGKFQTPVQFFFAHVNHDGKLMKIEISKPGGTRFFIKVDK